MLTYNGISLFFEIVSSTLIQYLRSLTQKTHTNLVDAQTETNIDAQTETNIEK